MTFIKLLQFINQNDKLSVVDFNTHKQSTYRQIKKTKKLAKWITLCYTEGV